MATCKWCGKTFTKKHNREEYCNEKCRKYGNQENTRNRVRIFRKKYYLIFDEKQKYGGVGTGFLTSKRKENFDLEYYAIQNEKRKLNIK